jgi:malonate-semialdehyde dehydrogenase (acetylating)/methylmalonate-semialdehyde dehydrogenase
MIPMWMFPVAIACGNTFVLKPSDRCPITAAMIADILLEGGLPPGVLNIVHGDAETSRALCDHPGVEAVSFVGSTAAAREVYRRATGAGKRCQALGGAKNHLVVMPDAHLQATVDAIIGSAFGCAGERCMASAVLTLVGENQPLLDALVDAAGALRLGHGLDPETTLGPVISAAHKKRIEDYVRIGLEEGAELIRDGRGEVMDGHFVGPCILDRVTPDMRVGREEIFGPVLSVMHAADLDEALDLVNASDYGNGASIFTESGEAAHRFRRGVECGMVGINAGVPAPMAFISFGGRKNSLFGDLKLQGTEGIEFYTKSKAVIERWFGHGDVWGR